MSKITFTYRGHDVCCRRTAPGEAWTATACRDGESIRQVSGRTYRETAAAIRRAVDLMIDKPK